MAGLEDLVRGRSPLTSEHIHRIQELVADWQLLADLSFADLVLWVPLRKDLKSWPTGYVAISHIRPTTAATLFPHDVIGDEIDWGSKPLIDKALSSGEIIRDSEPELVGDVMIKVESVPVIFESQVIAVISRHRSAESMSTQSRLELNYREIAHKLYAMVCEGTFPYPGAHEYLDPAPRVGDGLIRLDVNGVTTFASPNARSAYNRLGWDNDLEGFNLGEISEKVHKNNHNADDQGLRSRLNGKQLQRAECENEGGTIDLIVLPLLAKGDRIGAIVLIQNVTELRRRERVIVTKDVTIKEIHHRVKNNLQTVSALLRLQARRIEDPSASAALDEAVRRIASIALVHETLSTSSEASVAFDQVLDSLITHALDLSPRMSELKVIRTGEISSLDPRIATPLALVITELIHNALEHGLATQGSGLQIAIERSSKDCVIEISDDGVGLPSDFNFGTSSNLGLQIVRTLTENELKGSIELSSTEIGTMAKLTFPL
ncbi:MAG: histidine kinase [Actinobacteria bacterium]|uniref:histidine kinase n=1 Tax=freshwater metagenome TaxID=449393 RepID=A0A6J6TWU5_9ZZZZ|nr:histidine kinase [Actinomycetota bacterium]